MTGPSGGPLRALEPVLDQLRAWSPVYQRWWHHPCRRDGAAVRPWSEPDEERLTRLAELDAGLLTGLAEQLRRVGAELADVGEGLAAVAGHGGIPAVAAQRCAAVARAVGGYEADSALLMDSLHRAADRVGPLLESLVRQVLREAEGLAAAARYPSVGMALQDIDAADVAVAGFADPDRWRPLDELVDRHGSVLAALRAGLAEVDQLGTADAPSWCDPDSGCTSEPTRPVWVWRRWHALPLDEDIAPGNGPELPGTEGRHAESTTGVRVPRLPDRPGPSG